MFLFTPSPSEREFVHALGDAFDGSLADEYLISRILRPIDNAIRKLFDRKPEDWPPDQLRALQIRLANWEGCRDLPLYGPRKGWAELVVATRSPSSDQEAAIILLASEALAPDFFTGLKSRLKRNANLKKELDSGARDGPAIASARTACAKLTETAASSPHTAQTEYRSIKLDREVFAGGTLFRGMGRAFFLESFPYRLLEIRRDGSLPLVGIYETMAQAELAAKAALAGNKQFNGDIRSSIPLEVHIDVDGGDIKFVHCRNRSFRAVKYAGHWTLEEETVHCGTQSRGTFRSIPDWNAAILALCSQSGSNAATAC